MINFFIVYLSWCVVISVVTFIAFGWDKHRARNEGRRTSERTLLWLTWLGGWPGALLARRAFRHKTQKFPFILPMWIGIVIHWIAVGLVVYGISKM